MKERRKYKRFTITLEMKYRIPGWGEDFVCVTKNIGGGGACVILDDDLKDKTPLELFFPPVEKKGENGFVLRGEKVWSREVDVVDDKLAMFQKGPSVPPLQSPYTESLESRPQRCFEVGIKFLDVTSEKVVDILKYLSAYFDAQNQ